MTPEELIKRIEDYTACTCDAKWSGVDEKHYQAVGCPPCICNHVQDVPRLCKALRLALYYVEGDATWEGGLCYKITKILEGEGE